MKQYLVFLSLFILLVGCEKNVTSSTYETYEQAQPMIEKGWVPSGLPNEITDIVEVHDLDKNIGNGMFKLEQDDILPFIFALTPVNKEVVLSKEVLVLEGWDKERVRSQIEAETLTLGDISGVLYAVDETGLVYYWIH